MLGSMYVYIFASSLQRLYKIRVRSLDIIINITITTWKAISISMWGRWGKITGNIYIHIVDSRVRTTRSRLIIRRTNLAARLYYTLIIIATHIQVVICLAKSTQSAVGLFPVFPILMHVLARESTV